MGRRVAAGEDRRNPINSRIKDSLRARLEEVASNSGKTLSHEIEDRLERSFSEADIAENVARAAVGRALEEILGTGDTKKLLIAFATSIRLIEIQTGKSFPEDDFTKIVVSKSIWLIYRSLHGPVTDEEYSKDDQAKMMELAQKAAVVACGIVDLQTRGKLTSWVAENLPNMTE